MVVTRKSRFEAVEPKLFEERTNFAFWSDANGSIHIQEGEPVLSEYSLR
jgi:hypothetical protein